MSQRHVSARKGFTLIELLVVITIIGILAAALLPQILGAPARARDTARVAAVSQIVTAIETYNSDNGSYPAVLAPNCVPGAALDSYFQGGSAPKDPNNKIIGGCPPGTYYYCVHDGSPVSYSVGAAMEITGGQANGLDTELEITCNGTQPFPSYTAGATSNVYVIAK